MTDVSYTTGGEPVPVDPEAAWREYEGMARCLAADYPSSQDDLVLEARLGVWQAAKSYTPGSRHYWVHRWWRTSIHRCIEAAWRWRYQRLDAYCDPHRVEDELALLRVPAKGNGMDEMNTRLTVQEAMSRLTDEERTVIQAIVIEGYTWRETAQLVGYTQRWIRPRLDRGLSKLREALSDDNGEG